MTYLIEHEHKELILQRRRGLMNISSRQIANLSVANRDFVIRKMKRKPMATRKELSESDRIRRAALLLRKTR